MKTISIFITVFFVSFSANCQDALDKMLSKHNSHSVPYISVEELKMRENESSVVILDAREPGEFEVSHLENAHFVGYSDFSSEEISQLFKDKSGSIVVYCSVGIRSENISQKLKNAGFTEVRNLYGGIFEWKNRGYEVYDSLGKPTEKVHTYSKNWSKWLKNGEKIY